jgi:UDP-N-acetylmuramate--alanine ligase
VHFVGIGGVGMSCIARIYLARRIPVSGSDVRENREVVACGRWGRRSTSERRREPGRRRHRGGVLGDPPEQPEVVEAVRRKLPVLPRAAALAAAMVGRRSVAVAGTHGKTTTTSMLTVALQHSGADPSFAIGGNLNESGANAHDGTGDVFVAEADESDGSFLLYSPTVAIVTNVEADHLDHYGTADAVDTAFLAFADRIETGGALVACADDAGARRVVDHARAAGTTVHTYGESPDADVRITDLELLATGVRFGLVARGRRLGVVGLAVPGRHNALNAAAAFTAGAALGFNSSDLRTGLERFTGTRRRFELKGTAGGVRVYDDYAHHPTEIDAILQTARSVAGGPSCGGRLPAAPLQPYRRLPGGVRSVPGPCRRGGRDGGLRLGGARAAGDHRGSGGGGRPAATGSGGVRAVLVAGRGQLARRAMPGDVVLTLGAGDVTMIGPEVLSAIEELGEDAAGDATAAGGVARVSRSPSGATLLRPVEPARAPERRRLRRILLLAALLAVVAAAVWVVGSSSILGLRDVRVEGTRTLRPAQVAALVDVPRGTPLVRVDTAAVSARVGALALVAHVEVTRSLPGTLVVTVRERTPVAVQEDAGRFRLLDRDGVAYANVAKPPKGMTRIQARADSPPGTLRDTVGVVLALPPALRNQVLAVTATSPNAIGLRLRGGRIVVWGGAVESPKKALVLQALLRQKARVYDVSAPDTPHHPRLTRGGRASG